MDLPSILGVTVSQIAFNFARTAANRHTVQDNAWHTIKWGVAVQCLWLATNYLGIKAMFEHDYLVVLFYVLGGAVGTYLAFKIKIKEN